MTTGLQILATACLALLVAGSRPAAQTATLNKELLKDWMQMKVTMAKLANEMPEDRFSFKATAPQRDFAQQILHVATANVSNLRFLGGKSVPPTIDRNARSKSDVIKAMTDSFDYGTALIGEQTDESLLVIVPTNQFLGSSSRARVIYFLLGHAWDIYGQMAVYLRLNGGVPPASQRP